MSDEKKLVLVGLVEPKTEDLVEAFNEWYLGNHVEDTSRAPHVISARVLKAARDFAGPAPSGYITIYEIDGSDPEVAERILGEYQSDPNAWDGREPNNGSLGIVGAGWYHEVLTFGPSTA